MCVILNIQIHNMDLTFFELNRFNPAIFIPQIRKEWKTYFEIKAFEQYDPIFHNVLKEFRRKNKQIWIPDPSGACQIDGENAGKPILVPSTVYVNRIPLALQPLIVSRGAAFLTGGKATLKSKPQNIQEELLFDAVQSTWRKNKLQFKNSTIAQAFMSETECAEIWYSKVNDDGSVSMKCKIYQPSKGFELIPVFDSFGDLLAFGLGYVEVVSGKKIKHMDIYDSEYLTRHINSGSGWETFIDFVEENIFNTTDSQGRISLPYGKIPVIYYSLDKSIWANVQWAIERLETLMSNLGDQNDYSGSPILKVKGDIEGFSSKGESGKVLQLVGEDADASYVTADQAPEAIKMEKEWLLDFIYTTTQTPNISFSEMKGLGDISGAAFDRMMIDGHLKATSLQNGMYGECIQRRLNFLLYACAEIEGLQSAKDMEISVEFGLFSIDSVADNISNALLANGNKPVLDQKSSIQMAGVTDDVDATYQAIQKQNTDAIAAQQEVAKAATIPIIKPTAKQES